MLFRKEVSPKLKMALYEHVKDNFNCEDDNHMVVEACLSDHEVFRLDKKLDFGEFGLDANPEYVMFLEKARNGAFGVYQVWDFLAFSKEDLEEVAKANGVFSYDELCCMEAFEHWEDDEED